MENPDVRKIRNLQVKIPEDVAEAFDRKRRELGLQTKGALIQAIMMWVGAEKK